jgi:hypothetical protein
VRAGAAPVALRDGAGDDRGYGRTDGARAADDKWRQHELYLTAVTEQAPPQEIKTVLRHPVRPLDR